MTSPTPANGNERTAREGASPTGVMTEVPPIVTFMSHSSNLIKPILQTITETKDSFIKRELFNIVLLTNFLLITQLKKAAFNSRKVILFLQSYGLQLLHQKNELNLLMCGRIWQVTF